MCFGADFTFGRSPPAAIAWSRSRSFSRILIFSEELSEASRARIFDLSMRTFQESALEPLPLFGQVVTLDDTLQLFAVDRALLDKLQDAVVIFGAACSQRDGSQVFGSFHNFMALQAL